ncbi:GATOR2-SEACAT complex WD repeat subunit Sea2 [Schizosaccharomyces pombe]|uniref:Uncharacterized WD repeat-containing protein C4F8.11 n=1 Tax=Schizosaccharomyces pombe (strain 972 / ATCC 24843) TaxID=284812 RepID=YDSB_SCHPO|nr:WD repeat-containing protein [Schizosaccharomyces pombe]O14186.1 RecName: Full=Uncharacterized WD repeat-containing protein C4F8.11 [Schizosaccharomyces pombe 972h-]CAB11058.1 WD repeat protein, human WDR24 family [Schizosaccharomyces pombe]|eukprot:NP_593862.1 WD repeat-containing protein [Schizosaccharomyces pombe]
MPSRNSNVLQRPTYAQLASTSVKSSKGLVSYQDWVVDVKASISAISVNKSRTKVGVAGRELLKVLAVNPNSSKPPVCISDLLQKSTQTKHISCNDVKWGSSFASNLIFTCSPLGNLNVWDVNLEALLYDFNEHSRAVHKLDISSFHPSYVLTASQDGLIKLWDYKESSSTITFRGNSEAARDVVFSPSEPNEFVAAYDSGILQKWDIRFPKLPFLKLAAHNGVVLCVNYSPNGVFLASCGRDKTIRIWDSTSNKKKSLITINNVSPLNCVRWRPANQQSRGSNQLASSSLVGDTAINVWDITRPYIPYRTVSCHDSIVSTMHWASTELLWSCSKDGIFSQTRVENAFNCIDMLPRATSSWSTKNSLVFSSNPISNQRLSSLNRVASFESNISSLKSALYASQNSDGSTSNPVPFVPHNFVGIPQELGILAYRSEDVAQFCYLAKNYRISGDISSACKENAFFARNVGAEFAYQIWDALYFSLGVLNNSDKGISELINIPFVSANNSMADDEKGRNLKNLTQISTSSTPAHDNLSLNDFFEPREASTPSESSNSSIESEDNLDKAVLNKQSQWHDLENPIVLKKGQAPVNNFSTDSRASINSSYLLDSAASNYSGTSHNEMFNSFHRSSVTSASIKSREAVLSAGNSSRRASIFLDQLSLHGDTDSEIPIDDLPPIELPYVVTSIISDCISRGDVQTAACVCSVFSYLTIDLPRIQLDDLLESYVDLLRRFGMFSEATLLINMSGSKNLKYIHSSSRDLIFEMENKKATGNEQSEKGKENAKTVTSLKKCVYCELPLRGVLVYPPVCGHIGHESCLRSWYFDNTDDALPVCPVPGCGVKLLDKRALI